jgi:hypothetical protein
MNRIDSQMMERDLKLALSLAKCAENDGDYADSIRWKQKAINIYMNNLRKAQTETDILNYVQNHVLLFETDDNCEFSIRHPTPFSNKKPLYAQDKDSLVERLIEIYLKK